MVRPYGSGQIKLSLRSTPALMGLFSIVCFSALSEKLVKSTHNTGYVLFPVQKWEAILYLLAMAA